MKEDKKKLELETLTNPEPFIDDDMGSNDQISLMAIQELLNFEKLKSITRIKPEQVSTITKLYLYATTFKSPFTKILADMILELQISINGLGRKELVALVQKRAEMEQQQIKVTSKDIFR